MVLSTFLFGVMNVLVKYLERLPSHELVLFRSLVMFFITLYMLRRARLNPFVWQPRWVLIGRGVAGSLALLIYFFTIQQLPLASAVTIGYLSPIFTILFASYLLRESVRVLQWVFFGVSFVGIILMHGLEFGQETGIVMLGILGASFSGLAYNALRATASMVPTLVVVFFLPLCTIPIVIPFCLQEWVMPVGWEWLLIIAMGAVTQAAQIFMTKAYQLEKAGAIANYAYLGVVFALAFGFIFFSEKYPLISIAGMGVVILGILLNFLYVNRVTSLKRLLTYFRWIPGL